jgi:hypothetical protein
VYAVSVAANAASFIASANVGCACDILESSAGSEFHRHYSFGNQISTTSTNHVPQEPHLFCISKNFQNRLNHLL